MPNRAKRRMKQTTPLQSKFSLLATTPCRGLSLFRYASDDVIEYQVLEKYDL